MNEKSATSQPGTQRNGNNREKSNAGSEALPVTSTALFGLLGYEIDQLAPEYEDRMVMSIDGAVIGRDHRLLRLNSERRKTFTRFDSSAQSQVVLVVTTPISIWPNETSAAAGSERKDHE